MLGLAWYWWLLLGLALPVLVCGVLGLWMYLAQLLTASPAWERRGPVR